MIPGIRGRLITASFAETALPALCGNAAPAADVVRRIEEWSARVEREFGPASSVRAITDALAIPLVAILGFDIIGRTDSAAFAALEAGRHGIPLVPVAVAPWNEPLETSWRPAVGGAIRRDARWAFCCNGTHLRIVDAHRTWSRLFLEFDLALLAHDEPTLTLLWRVACAEAMTSSPPVLHVAVEGSARHGVGVCGLLADGVLDALQLLYRSFVKQPAVGAAPRVLLDQSLTVLYRVLFLLFAEARGLVPMWHQVYRDRYTIDSIVATLLSGRRYRGVWAAVRAISRLAHAGCAAGALKVTAFNGRLFAPAGTGVLDRASIGDDVMADAVLAVSTTPPLRGAPRQRIVYQDLDVEELGAVYEHVLDYEPAGRGALVRTRDVRKSTGTFYTPRPLTSYLVRETLAPLLANRSVDQILELRVLDPAMGSGAFLVAACAQIAEAAEAALVRDGRWHRGDITATDRVALRRDIAQRCLYGVDLNPTAVQVARLSLWLTTLAADKPLTFLDHRLVAGNSLVGAAIDDVVRQPSASTQPARTGRADDMSLFDAIDLQPVMSVAVNTRTGIAEEPDDTAAIVRAKERALAGIQHQDAPLGRYGQLLDLWCAGWFWPDGRPPDRGTFGALADHLLGRPTGLSRRLAAPFLDHVARISAEQRFLHWPLAFPEVFTDRRGCPQGNAGFDAIIGNPPWDMVRGDSGGTESRSVRRDDARHLTAFVRSSGVYRVEAKAHVNRYQLFVERALQLVRRGGRIGLVLPASAVSDTGTAPLRRFLFDHASVDAIASFDNRRAIFPIHRSVRFVLLTATAGEPTESIRLRFGLNDPQQLDESVSVAASPFVLTRRLIARLSGDDDLAIPDVQGDTDIRILERVAAHVPTLSAADGWNVSFGRELNATDDLALFERYEPDGRRRAVLEGKMIEPFRTSLDRCRYQLRDGISVRVPRRPRLAYRDVASATNRLTLIAAIVPASAVTTHTLFCLKTTLPLDAQHALCALLNSFVANYLVRFRVNTHVTVNLVSRLRVPKPDPDSRVYQRLSALAQDLMHSPGPAEEQPEYAELQAITARAYGLSEADFVHILLTFPLIPEATRKAARIQFNNIR
jgi:hypothetical protein